MSQIQPEWRKEIGHSIRCLERREKLVNEALDALLEYRKHKVLDRAQRATKDDSLLATIVMARATEPVDGSET